MTRTATGTLAVTGDEVADRLINEDPLALLLGMLLDQQIPMEWAFMGPRRLADRLGSELDAHDISERNPEAFAALVKAKPALHRFPGSMAQRMQALCRHVADRYDGDASTRYGPMRTPASSSSGACETFPATATRRPAS